MYTSAECLKHADRRRRNRLITAAEAWLFLAGQMKRGEAAFANDEVVTKRRSKSRMKTKAAT
jgi:hypothetical protein